MRTSVALLIAWLAVTLTCSGQSQRDRKLPDHIRLSDGLTPLAKAPAVGVKPTLVWTTAPPVAGTSCGHITVLPVTPEIDPRAIVKVPAEQGSNMPMFKGLPACPSAR